MCSESRNNPTYLGKMSIVKVEFTSSDVYKIGKAFSNQSLIDEFANYHKQVAKLRITTKTANLKQKKKDW